MDDNEKRRREEFILDRKRSEHLKGQQLAENKRRDTCFIRIILVNNLDLFSNPLQGHKGKLQKEVEDE